MEYSLHNPHFSLWHQSPFLELQHNIQAPLSPTQDEGEEGEEEEECNHSLTQRAETYYGKKAELVRRVRYMHLLSLPSPDSTPESTVEDAPNFLEEYEVSRLLQDYGKHLTELSRRNDEKRETIRKLRYRVEQLKQENEKLRDENSTVKVEGAKECSMMVSRGGHRQSSSQFGRLKELILGSILGKGLNDLGHVWE